MEPSSPPSGNPNTRQTNAFVRNALRISWSQSEYKILHDHLFQKLPDSLRKRAYHPTDFNAVTHSKNNHTDAALRSSFRVFLGTATGAKLFGLISNLLRRKAPSPNGPPHRFLTLRLSLSLSLVLLLHRLLYRFFVRLRANLRRDEAQAFRDRNPRAAKLLTSKYAPAVGASLAGFLFGIAPQESPRATLAIYTVTRSLEFAFNALVENGWFKSRPWWFGNWLLIPISAAQLFHAFIFDRETIPKWFGDFILRFTPGYIQQRPAGFPTDLHWPDQYETIDTLGKISELRWPPFTSPILHPSLPSTLPASVQTIAPITSPAHPAISSLACALLHPKSTSCLTAFLHQSLLSIPPLTRFLTKVFLALSLLKLKTFLLQPISAINYLSRRVLASTALLSTSIGMAWGTICLFNSILPRSVLPTQRFYLSGALAGLPFAFASGVTQRSHSLYFFRLAVDSAWKVGVKRGLWRGYKGGDLCLIVVSWALIGSILEGRPNSVPGSGIRKVLAWLKGDGFTDPTEKRSRRKNMKINTE